MEKSLSFIGLNNFTIDDTGIIRKYYNGTFIRKYTGNTNNTGYMVWYYAHKCYLIHRLVAQAFIPNPNKCKTVNHKDGNKLNNNVNNLEWCTQLENNVHSFYTLGHKVQKVGMYTLDWELLEIFDSYEMAQTWLGRPGRKGVWEACNNPNKRPNHNAYGYKWKKL